jgi:hypothetical protein
MNYNDTYILFSRILWSQGKWLSKMTKEILWHCRKRVLEWISYIFSDWSHLANYWFVQFVGIHMKRTSLSEMKWYKPKLFGGMVSIYQLCQ